MSQLKLLDRGALKRKRARAQEKKVDRHAGFEDEIATNRIKQIEFVERFERDTTITYRHLKKTKNIQSFSFVG